MTESYGGLPVKDKGLASGLAKLYDIKYTYDDSYEKLVDLLEKDVVFSLHWGDEKNSAGKTSKIASYGQVQPRTRLRHPPQNPGSQCTTLTLNRCGSRRGPALPWSAEDRKRLSRVIKRLGVRARS